MIAKRFEDLIFWQKARELTRLIYGSTSKVPFKNDYGLREQLQRSAVSVMSNIAEGFGRGSNTEFVQFLFVAKGSLSEVKSQLYVAMDLNYVTPSEFNKAYKMTEEISKLINAFIKSLKEDKKRGLKTC
ncbi:MAG TPA: four helix bundle protein [Nitrospirota bacterium]